MKYLVTDDSKLARLSLIKSLKAHVGEAEILQAENGQAALDIIKSEKINVVFLDLTMPIMDGYKAIPLIKRLDSELIIVIVSADVQEQAKRRVIKLGAKLHIQKPINADKMKEILDSL